jgi:hypothetical protein
VQYKAREGAKAEKGEVSCGAKVINLPQRRINLR